MQRRSLRFFCAERLRPPASTECSAWWCVVASCLLYEFVRWGNEEFVYRKRIKAWAATAARKACHVFWRGVEQSRLKLELSRNIDFDFCHVRSGKGRVAFLWCPTGDQRLNIEYPASITSDKTKVHVPIPFHVHSSVCEDARMVATGFTRLLNKLFPHVLTGEVLRIYTHDEAFL